MTIDNTRLRRTTNSRRQIHYLTFPRWPENGCDWIHSEDADTARGLLPGQRVFAHRRTDGDFQVYEYGTESFRALPRMQKCVRGDGFLVGDRVEIRSRLGRRRALVAIICDMSWDDYHQRIDYRIRYRQLNSQSSYASEELLRLIPPDLPVVEFEINASIPGDHDSDVADYQISPLENLS